MGCATVPVPIDRSGAVGGSIPLHVERVRALGRRRSGAVFALAGGPGQAASPFTQAFATLLRPALGSRDLIVFDQRGTGRSGVLRCPVLERELAPETGMPEVERVGAAIAGCAAQLGPRRAFYTTSDTVEDIEAVRREIGIERIALVGVSYGTKVALAYAERYPQHVERLVLDSTVEPDGPSPFGLETFAAVPRVLRGLCATAAGCQGITQDPAADLSSLISAIVGLGAGYVVGPDGRRRPATLDRVGLYSFLVAADAAPQLRLLFPAAVQSALRGDLAPILRLVTATAESSPDDPGSSPALFSTALFVATVCHEGPLPYDPNASPVERRAQTRERVDALPDSALFPFDRETALETSILDLCVRWPHSGRPAAPLAPPEGALTAAPTLILSGGQDLRTPLEEAQRVVARLPSGTLVLQPTLGHSVLGTDIGRCSRRALRLFFAGQNAGARCSDVTPLGRPVPIAPASIAEVPPAGGASGKRARTLTAVGRTIDDVSLGLLLASGSAGSSSVVRGGGLRAGRFRFKVEGLDPASVLGPGDDFSVVLKLFGVVYVPGVRVSGTLRLDGDLKLAGRVRITGGAPATGRLRVRSTRRGYALSGTLDGRRVRARVPSQGGL